MALDGIQVVRVIGPPWHATASPSARCLKHATNGREITEPHPNLPDYYQCQHVNNSVEKGRTDIKLSKPLDRHGVREDDMIAALSGWVVTFKLVGRVVWFEVSDAELRDSR